MSDSKLRAVLVYRLEGGRSSTHGDSETGDGIAMTGPASTTMLAKYDYASEYDSHAGSTGGLYGDKEKNYADAVGLVVGGDPPGGVAEEGVIGGFKVVQSDMHQVVYGADADGLCLAVVTGLKYPSRTTCQLLSELYPEYSSEFSLQAKSATTNALSKKSKSLLKTYCKKYDDSTKVDKASALNSKVDAVKVQMQDNIAAMLQNTEQAETLAERSNQLNEQANVFQKKSKDLRKQMRCKNIKMTIVLVALVVGILVIVLVPLIMKAKKAYSGGDRMLRGLVDMDIPEEDLSVLLD
mmetsp:Transcript_684/g.1255  ORF Transcript_684/g.1255 Transcript_684/m.1255 type:complete len:295 (-) Transcript_684:284-1168(-)|eukprot:CAMPEP_0183725892 /NCGR_PEP_ID=MMETSP0737-20130205/21882_1 /TAXON_ID=385413 /ORGANISM="Thalassiosira miniscula, Strain CCMP1093" /LENGTH=294 /DNA_ID=CAMNT_0025957053 /DNA_START=48 /DNA_END=932 /DNA_ORIENTATION=-